MYSFEGDFRRKPIQSMRGASKKEETLSLLKRAQNERQKREDIRQRIESAIKIQKYYRGYSIRQSQARTMRENFDLLTKKPPEFSMFLKMTRQLNFFFKEKEDGQRLIWICQHAMKMKKEFIEYIQGQDDLGIVLVKHLLSMNLRYLVSIAYSQSPVAVPMRILEVFTAVDSYPSYSKTAFKIWSFLIEKGYFHQMRVLLEAKVPSSLERSPNPPTPQAESIFQLIMNPIVFATQSQNKLFCKDVLKSLCQYVLCPAYSEQVEQFLLPAMVYAKYPFPFVDLIQTLITHTSSIQTPKSEVNANINSTPWLLGSVLMYADKFLENLSSGDSSDFLLVLHNLLPHLPSLAQDGVDNDSDDDSMDTDSAGLISPEMKKLANECVQFLNSQKFVRCVVKCLQSKMEPQLVSSVCMICHSLISQQNLSIHKLRLLYSLAFNKQFMRSLWYTCISVSNTTITGSKISLIQTLSRGLPMTSDDIQRIVPMLSVFCSMFSHSLYTLHDADFYGNTFDKESSMPFQLTELVPMVLMLRDTCLGIIELAHPDGKLSVTEDYREALRQTAKKDKQYLSHTNSPELTSTWSFLFKVIATLVRQLYIRDSRQHYCPTNSWLSDRVHIQANKPSQIYRSQGSVFTRRPFGTMRTLTKVQIDDSGPPLSNTDVKNLVILTELPFIVSFTERVKILQKLIQNDRDENQGDAHNFLSGASINVMIRRNYIYEDAFEKLSPENEPDLKKKMRVQLVNAAGLDEVGIDGGGIFREFLSELLKTGFDPNRGLFLMTTDRLLYPNPQSVTLMENYAQHYYFLGRMLGKALYENMLVEIPFASFFLSKILSRHGGDLDIHHLASLDPELYKNLLFLKTYEGDVKELGLDFTAVKNDFGQTKVEELKPGGRNIPVDNSNKIEYIHLMADYKINKQIRNHCIAFRRGMSDLVNLEWLRMFDHHELQTLISGALVPVNIEDLKQHTNYSGGYTVDHPVIKNFWKVVERFTDQQKRQLLKFVTSCSRPPLLGFKDLYPAFCVHFGGSELDRLPTASTCMNLLKLPEFRDEETMKAKLLYAIESGAGFELS